MRGFSLVMLMSITYAACTTSCPASCVVCSEDTIVCHKLASIIGVPETTKVLMLTDGKIDSVDNGTLSDLSNMTLLGLSNNVISNITDNAFQNLPDLRVLLLDHNLITGLSIEDSTFAELWSLEILQLGNNAIQAIDGSWFRDMRSLRTLQLEGNLITRLNSDTFASTNLDNLETLDLSDNLIEYVARGSFLALPRLRSLDLSRNSLRSAPDAFSYLSWLSALNLDLNQWNCTCELQELASFLSSYVQAPDKVLYNGRRMVCLSAANPAVQTVLQLTEANCVPPNENITIIVKTKDSISARRYVRDIALAATFFFAGGVGLTVVILYIIYHKLELNKGSGPWRNRSWDEEAGTYGGAVQNRGVPEWSYAGDDKAQVLSISHPGRETKLAFPNGGELPEQRRWHRDRAPRGHGPARAEHHFVCHLCSPAGLTAADTAGSWGADSSGGIVSQAVAKSGTHNRLDFREEGKSHMPHHAVKHTEDLRVQSQYQRRQEGQPSFSYPEDHMSTDKQRTKTDLWD
ncbi:hypothetical protein MATL_G00238100 [Megalops atlanticus]|uniref:LRRCT domain-containing protein n=1 Tax=Megalops atlanticus TaxID=7932 RepID=A0A9D3SVH2_MEGAT|nr:hypothetical protein MATL_G00238100 [Megalops atlanticus]